MDNPQPQIACWTQSTKAKVIKGNDDINRLTCAKLIINIKQDVMHESHLADKVHPYMPYDWTSFAVFRYHQQRYEKDAKQYHDHEMAARAKAKAIHLNDREKQRSLKAAIYGSTSTPLLCLTRDVPGPRGEAVGIYTTHPAEVDGIAQRAWGKIAKGNITDKDALVDSFIRKHGYSVYTDSEFHVEPITGEQLKAECLHVRKSAGGLDHFEPADFALLGDLAFSKLASLLNAIEDGAEWPEDVTVARAAFLAKDADNLENPLAYRVLLIMPVLYRRWASCRLRTMAAWIKR